MTYHKNKAEEFLEQAQGFFWEDNPVQVNLRLVAAQAHATVYLAEQQRIANLIAFGEAKRADILALKSDDELSTWLHDGNGVEGYLSASQLEELGVS